MSQSVILIDWQDGGHNATYLSRFFSALRSLGCDVGGVVVHALRDRLQGQSETEGEEIAACFRGVEWPGFLRGVRPVRLQLAMRRRMFASRIAAQIKRIEERHGKKADLLFFTSLFEDEFDLVRLVLAKARRPWSFLYLHPYYFHPENPRAHLNAGEVERLLADPQLRAITTINEDVAESIGRTSGRKVIVFPDITDERNDPEHPLARRIRTFAGKRTLIGVVSLAPWKGIGLLAKLCLKADPSQYAFLFAGHYNELLYSKEDAGVFFECLNHAPNAFFHLARLPDGSIYNAALSALDIVFCAGENSPFSNNTLTKIALLRKPVIVTENSLAAVRVKTHRLGKVIPKNDVYALLDAVEELVAAARSGPVIAASDAQGYFSLHDSGALIVAFGSLLEVVA